jgi:hypothetical protein
MAPSFTPTIVPKSGEMARLRRDTYPRSSLLPIPGHSTAHAFCYICSMPTRVYILRGVVKQEVPFHTYMPSATSATPRSAANACSRESAYLWRLGPVGKDSLRHCWRPRTSSRTWACSQLHGGCEQRRGNGYAGWRNAAVQGDHQRAHLRVRGVRNPARVAQLPRVGAWQVSTVEFTTTPRPSSHALPKCTRNPNLSGEGTTAAVLRKPPPPLMMIREGEPMGVALL